MRPKANFKFVFEDSKIIYSPTIKGGLAVYLNNRDEKIFTIYVPSQTGGWEFVRENDLNPICSCGGYYTDTITGDAFRWQEMPLLHKRVADVVKSIQLPILCMVCYYKKELNAGRFCPNFVKRKLGLVD